MNQLEISEGDMRTQGKVALAGGGGANDSRLLDEVFAAWIGSHGKLLYWPLALRGIRSFQSCLEWITTTFAPLNVTDITMWTELTEHQASELEEFDAVYIGGGNTFNLLAELKESGFERYLRAYVQGGKAVFGGRIEGAVGIIDAQPIAEGEHALDLGAAGRKNVEIDLQGRQPL